MDTTTHTRLVKKSLRYSILDGSAYSAMLGLTQDTITPFALALKATTAQIGLLSSLPNLAMAFSQLAVPRLAERAISRKKFILPIVFAHALMWLPVLLIPYFFPGDKVWWLIGFFAIITVLGSLGNPVWGSMMADLVPEGMRGNFFGFRGRVGGLLTLIFFFIGGAILEISKKTVLIGFSIIFGGALFFRLISGFFLSRMYDPPSSVTRKNTYRLLDVLKKMPVTNVGRFIIYVALMKFATYLAGPFFAVFMLRDLKFSYLTYVGITATSDLVNILFLSFWGRRADKAGNIKVLKITALLVPLVPLLWMGSREIYYLIPIQFLSGFAWSGFNLVSVNFLYDAASPENRTQYIAISNALNGVAICLGALTGGLLATHFPSLLGYQLLSLFLISGVARGLVAIRLFSNVFEMRRVRETTTAELLFGGLHLPRNPHATRRVLRIHSPFLSPELKLRRMTVPVYRDTPAWWRQLNSASRAPPIDKLKICYNYLYKDRGGETNANHESRITKDTRGSLSR